MRHFNPKPRYYFKHDFKIVVYDHSQYCQQQQHYFRLDCMPSAFDSEVTESDASPPWLLFFSIFTNTHNIPLRKLSTPSNWCIIICMLIGYQRKLYRDIIWNSAIAPRSARILYLAFRWDLYPNGNHYIADIKVIHIQIPTNRSTGYRILWCHIRLFCVRG